MDLKIGILCAGDSELEPFLRHFENYITTKKAMLTFYEGRIGSVPVVTLYSGVCKVNAAVATQILIDSYHVSCVINAGTAGGIDDGIQLFDTIVATQSAYHDVDDDILTEFHPWLPSVYFASDAHLLQMAEKVAAQSNHPYPIHFGRMVTGEKFITDDSRTAIKEKYTPLSVDMETAAVAHVCHVNQIPFLSIRSITDTGSHSGIENFEENCLQASEISKDVVLELLKLF